MYLLYLWCTSYKYQSILEQSFNQYTRYRYGTKFRYQSIRSPLTHGQGGLLLGVGDGGRVVRYSTLFLPKKIAQGLVEIDRRTLSCNKWSCKLYLKGKV
jgi:hypothetical protein